ncbi:MAG: RIP metalloprotease RseP [Salinibacter sp.]
MDVVLSLLSSTLWFLVALTILVFVHELGHFLTAKYFGMRVERFSIGFPPTLFGRTHGETEYAIGATPLGGYVKISGMIDESLDTDHVESEPDPWEFRAQPVWQRIIVISAGVVFNAFLAILIFGGVRWSEGDTYIPAQNVEQVYVEEGSVAYNVGLRTGDQIVKVNGEAFKRFDQMTPSSLIAADSLTVTVVREGNRKTLVGPPNIISRLSRARDREQSSRYLPGLGFQPPFIGGVVKGTPADSAGLQTGDRIIKISGDTVRFWKEMSTMLQKAKGAPVTVRWFRSDSLAGARSDLGVSTLVRTTEDGRVLSAKIAAEYNEKRDKYLLGVRSPGASPVTQRILFEKFGVRTQSYSPVEALQAGVNETWTYARTIVVTLKRIATGRDSLTDSLGGPVMIAKVTSQAASAGLIPYFKLIAALSITLAIMNILPIPALDGGQLLFLLYEAITRRRPSVRVRLVAQQVGMILLIGFMAFIIFNDIMRL